MAPGSFFPNKFSPPVMKHGPQLKAWFAGLVVVLLSAGIFLISFAGQKQNSVELVSNAVAEPQQKHNTSTYGARTMNGTDGVSVEYAAWAVMLSSASGPSAAVLKLASLPGWQVVVVADVSGAAGNKKAWQLPNVTYLDEEHQSRLPFLVQQHLPPHSHSRKVLGYLYAISKGAVAVYDASDEVELLQDHIPLLSCNQTNPELVKAHPGVLFTACHGTLTVLEANSFSGREQEGTLFNPYSVFGQPHLCPRGMAPGTLQNSKASICFARQPARPIIQQGLINGRPDVDQSYHGSQPLDVSFERSGFSMVLPTGTAAPINSLNTLYLKEALWALLLPVSPHAEAADIWRGLWSQQILRHMEAHVAVLPPTAARRPDTMALSTGNTASSGGMQQLARSAQLWRDLLRLEFKAIDVPARMLEAAQVMADLNYLQQGDLTLLQAWIQDLRALGYTFPLLKSNEKRKKKYANVPLPSAESWMTLDSLDNTFLFPRQWCMRIDTVMVINFNFIERAHAKKQMRLLHAVYRPHFRRVYLTGSHVVLPEPGMQSLMDQGYVLNCGHHSIQAKGSGFFAYACAAEGVLSAQQSVWLPQTARRHTTNMFHINDDVAYSPCMVQKLNYSNIWYSSHLQNLSDLARKEGWHWEKNITDRNITVRKSTELALTYAWGALVPRAARNPPQVFGEGHGQADIYFIPSRYLQMFVRFTSHFQSLWAISEVAVTNVVGMLADGPGDVDLIATGSAWGRSRDCVHESIEEILPLHADISQSAVRACQTKIWSDAEVDTDAGMLAIHPVKLSLAHVADRWLVWWLSQQCSVN